MNIELLASVAVNEAKRIEDDRNEENIMIRKHTLIKNKLRRVLEYMKAIKREDVNSIYENGVSILMKIPLLKIKKYTINKVVTTISSTSLREKGYNIPLKKIMDIVKRHTYDGEFTRSSKSTLDRHSVSSLKFIMEYVDNISGPYEPSVKEMAVDLCNKLKYPQKIINEVVDLMYVADDVTLLSRRKLTVSSSLVYFVAKRNGLNVSLDYISDASGSKPWCISKACSAINKLLAREKENVIVEINTTMNN